MIWYVVKSFVLAILKFTVYVIALGCEIGGRILITVSELLFKIIHQ